MTAATAWSISPTTKWRSCTCVTWSAAVHPSLHTLGTHWNISLFHYRSHGTDYGRVLAAFELGEHEPDFETRLNELGYECHDETHNPAFRFFLAG